MHTRKRTRKGARRQAPADDFPELRLHPIQGERRGYTNNFVLHPSDLFSFLVFHLSVRAGVRFCRRRIYFAECCCPGVLLVLDGICLAFDWMCKCV